MRATSRIQSGPVGRARNRTLSGRRPRDAGCAGSHSHKLDTWTRTRGPVTWFSDACREVVQGTRKAAQEVGKVVKRGVAWYNECDRTNCLTNEWDRALGRSPRLRHALKWVWGQITMHLLAEYKTWRGIRRDPERHWFR
jgi:hypothetical protein